MQIIENTTTLNALCQKLGREEFITIDLEFLREKTYYAHVCLIQVASPNEAAIIDPLAPGIELDDFFALLKNPQITKVFHSGRQDIEILYKLSGIIPQPLFDTQIAAMVLGFGESVSYENLVNGILGIELDKSCRLSNWSLRPLDEKQLQYALSDVTHLVKIYDSLRNRLKETGRQHWLDEETAVLTAPETYVVKPEDAWQKMKHRSHNARYLTILRELAAWRERRAQEKDIPRQMIIKDDCLLNLAAFCPTSREEMENIRNMRKDIVCGRLAPEILAVIGAAQKLPPEQYVKIEREKPIPTGATALYELLRLLLKIRSQEQGVVSKLIASDDDLKNFTSFRDKNNPILRGWRYEIFGQDAEALRQGRISISYNKEKKAIDIRKNTGD